jgi:hypothetical protein
LKIRLGAVGQEHLPCRFKAGAGFIEGGSTSIRAFARMTAAIETARPAPRVFVRRNAAADEQAMKSGAVK